MVRVAPFRGIRYNTRVVDPGDVTSPPYDVISPADRVYFHNHHPKNVVRLILGLDMPDDTPSDNRFTRANAYFFEWAKEGTLLQDPKPAVYAYDQHFTLRGQPKTVRGFVSLVKLHEYSEKVILPHENTLPRPKSDLAKLIKAVNSNLDSVYALYSDRERNVDTILERITGTAPVEEAIDRQSVRHRLWIIDDANDIEVITRTLRDKQVVIADGHHRYETSLAYRNELRVKDGNPASDRPYDYVMMTLVNICSPDLTAFPTHRMVRSLPMEAVEGLKEQLSEMFDIIPSSKEKLTEDMEARRGEFIGVYQPGQSYLVALKDKTVELDVSVLHEVILGALLGIDETRIRQEANVGYTRDAQEAMDAVDSGNCQIAFLLNPVELEVIMSVARAGKTLPQKATYFYPKLLSGLIMRKIEW